ncbi:Mut7-C RNAse domain-containing protein [Aliterella atlantica]|uniref:Twitching motility protein PilT n=1 Tax=Aliterella atlantica CENA595 TaxID=1618023 RepID=A0A0D8ZRF4_9CYAN|nr:twitching motility protein PilT [Aliterella atlantica CENA595]
MPEVSFRVLAELNDFLPSDRRQVCFTHYFKERPSIKDTIEALGVPHPEVEAIAVNGKWVDFAYIIQDKDQISVYPVSEAANIQNAVSLRSPLPQVKRFVLDIHLGKLAKSLRMLGFDTLYRNDYHDDLLADISSREGRILLTRDRGLLMRSIVTYGYYVRHTNPHKQLTEVFQRFALKEGVAPLQRCLRCNGLLVPVAKESIIDQLPPQVREQVDKFYHCQQCQQVYWQGTHYERMQEFIKSVVDK